MTFKKGDWVKINWEMSSLNGGDYPKNTICKVIDKSELKVVGTKHIIPVPVDNRTVSLHIPSKLEKALL